MNYRIEACWQGKTVKEFLFSRLSLSRAQVTCLKQKEQGILLNGMHVTVRAVLSEGDELALALEDQQCAKALLPADIPLEILYEDEDLVCVNKPRGMPTHPSRGHFEDTLANALAGYYAKKGRPFVFRAVNRLDRDTTGIVLVAKNKRAAAALSAQIAARTVDKEYLALLEGILEEDAGTIERNILRVQGSLMLRRTDDTHGERAFTSFRVLARSGDKTLVLATPHTGRTHQLRVHFAYLGHPIVGDSLYGKASSYIDGQALHACTLSFDHPISGCRLYIKAPLHDVFLNVLKEYDFDLSEKDIP